MLKEFPLKAAAEFIVDYAVDPAEDAVVLINGPQAADPLLTALFTRCLQRKTRPVVRVADTMHESIALVLDGDEASSIANIARVPHGARLDAIIHIRVQDADTHRLSLSKLAAFSRTADADAERSWSFLAEADRQNVRWIGVHFPDPVAVPALENRYPGYMDQVVRAAKLDTDDPFKAWERQRQMQSELCEKLSTGRELRFISERTDLVLSIENRRWINLDGHAINFPGGEVLSAPIEDSANGFVTFDFPIHYYGHQIEDARLSFRDGLAVDASAREGADALIAMLDTDAGARRIGEIAFGTNFDLTTSVGNALLDEKIGGTFHLAVGMAYPQTGGINRSAVHCDMIGDLRVAGRCELDGQTILSYGAFNP